MRIAIMGSGGIGGYLGARLAHAGEDVVFLARGAHLEAMRRGGLRLESPLGGVDLADISATDTPADVGTVDIVVFAVKLYDLESAARAIVPMVGPDTRVITFQNGIDSLNALSRHMARAQTIGGAIYVSAFLGGPGVIVHAGGATQTTIGGKDDATVEAFAAACRRAGGIEIQTVDDIQTVLWSKFVTLCAFSGATSLMRSGIGPILADIEARLFIEQLRDEGMKVASAAGHPMPDGFEARILALWQTFPPGTGSSMSGDLGRGRPIELAWLSGRMHSLGRELGVPTPGHSAVYRALHLHAGGTRE